MDVYEPGQTELAGHHIHGDHDQRVLCARWKHAFAAIDHN
jgi:hypothetical protein